VDDGVRVTYNNCGSGVGDRSENVIFAKYGI